MSSTSYPHNGEDWQSRFIANLAAALARRKDVTLSFLNFMAISINNSSPKTL